MKIQAIKEEWRGKHEYAGLTGKKMFTVWTFNNPVGKCVVMVINDRDIGKTVVAVIRVETGKDILNGHSRPCDNMDDAIDVAGEMISDNWDEIRSLI